MYFFLHRPKIETKVLRLIYSTVKIGSLRNASKKSHPYLYYTFVPSVTLRQREANPGADYPWRHSAILHQRLAC